MRSAPAVLLSFCLLLAASAQTPVPHPPPASSSQTAPLSAADQATLQTLLDLDEPGQQLRSLEAFLLAHPHAPNLAQIYTALLQDATQLNDPRRVLLYNEKLEALDPADLAQRIKTLNLLLLETDPAHQHLAQRDADTFARLVEAKAAEPPPAELGPTRWRLDLARLRALAALFQGTAAQALGLYPQAELDLVRSLQQGQTEEAAEHLANVYLAQAKIPQALDTFALALALPGDTIAGRAQLRAQAGALYRQLHNGSETGFGDLILRQFDQVAQRDAAEQHLLDATAHADANLHATSASAFVLTSLDGHTHSLAEDAGKVVVVDFWATWCGPCLVQHPLLAALRQQFATNPNVIFMAVNEDEDRMKIAPFLAAHHWSADTWLDAGLGGFFGVDSLPTTLILDPTGAVVYRQAGFVPETFELQLRQAIQQELARAFPAAAAVAGHLP